MQVLRRPLAPEETDHELIWLTVSVSSLGLAATWFALGFRGRIAYFTTLPADRV